LSIAGGLPNEAQAAKIILKDYVNVWIQNLTTLEYSPSITIHL
jgi:hypothetical protein